ncbi:hemogen [Denticeps clupeoides]|uniref:hemogen n=1 Tax=Denticeps clupeoides TaxID=299321 RepID=UPI0010A57B00|nr:hemogen [Denticeps clupeoides]
MEDTAEKEKPLDDTNKPDDQGGIHRRLRDREVLRKRKAEAEEKATNQWVYGAESRRKRGRQDIKTSTGKKGRPRKSTVTLEAQIPQEEGGHELLTEVPSFSVAEVLPQPSVPEGVSKPAETQLISASFPIPVAIPAPVPQLVSDPTQILSPVVCLSSGPPEDVLVEDLGPDEEEDIPGPHGNLVIDQGTEEDLSSNMTNIPEPNKVFTYPVFTSPPPQQEYLPGNFI